MLRLEWSPKALQDLTSIERYISDQGDPDTAAKIADEIFDLADTLNQAPQRIGRITPEYGLSNLREVKHKVWRIVYWFDETRVVIAKVQHQSGLLNLQDIDLSSF